MKSIVVAVTKLTFSGSGGGKEQRRRKGIGFLLRLFLLSVAIIIPNIIPTS